MITVAQPPTFVGPVLEDPVRGAAGACAVHGCRCTGFCAQPPDPSTCTCRHRSDQHV